MKKNSMRFLSFLLLAMMMVSLLAFGVLAEGEGTSTNVAKIGDVGYKSLNAALSAAGNGDTVVLQSNVTEKIDVPSGKSLTLELNGKTLNGSILARNATLTVQNGSIINTDSNVSAIEINAGKLTLTNVNVDSGRHAVRIDGAVVATINGGTYRGGIGTGTGTYHALNVSGTAEVDIEDGTFVGPKGSTTADSGSAVNVQAGASVEIYGGSFSGGKGQKTLASAGSLTVYGGAYDLPVPEEFCGYGLLPTEITSGTYGVKSAIEARIGNKAFATLKAAIEAAKDGEQVLLQADVYVTEKITISKNITISDYSTYTISFVGNGGFSVTDNADVSFTQLTLDISRAVAPGDCIIGIGNYSDDATLTLTNVNVVGDGYSSAFAVFYVYNQSTLNINGGSYTLSNDKSSAGGFIKAEQGKDGNVNITDAKIKLTDAKIGFLDGTVKLERVELTIQGGANAINQSALTVKDSAITIDRADGRALTLSQGDVDVQNSTLNFSNCSEGEIRFKNGLTLTIDEKSTISDCTVYTDVSAIYKAKINDQEICGLENNKSIIKDGAVTNPKWVANIGNNYYLTLQEAFKAATSGCTIEILADVTVDYYWDARYTGSKFTVPVSINGNNHTIKFTNTVYDGGNNMSAFRFEADATVKDLTIDMSEALSGFAGRFRAISAKADLTVENCTFIGNGSSNNTRAIIFGEGAGAAIADQDVTIINSVFSGWKRGISDNENAQDANTVTITGNTFNNSNVTISASKSVTFTGNTVANAYVNIKSYAANNKLGVTATGNTLTDNSETQHNIIEAATIEAQAEFVVVKVFNVANKAELNAALTAAKDGDIIVLTADIDYGTDQLAIAKAITLDLGGKTLTTRNAYGGMSVKNNPTIKNGTIVHASNTAAIKVWNATAFENLVIDVQGKGDANKIIGGIVLQSGSTTRVGSIKNVTIKGAALTNGIETYNCGDATEDVIGSLENVTIDAVGTGMLISAPVGKAENCSIKGGENAIEIWIKGNYSASLDLVNSKVEGGVYAHDEFNSNPGTVNNGTLSLTVDDKTTGVEITLTLARAENLDGVIKDFKDNAQAKIGDTYYATLADALAAAQDGDTVTLLTDVTIAATAGGYSKAGVIISGEILDGNGHTLTVTGANSTWDCGIYITGGTVKNITVKGAFRGIFTAGASADIYLDNVNFENVVYTFNSDGGNKQYGVYISNSTINGWTSFSDVHKEVVFTNCSFGKGSGYAFCRPYNTTVFNGCTFSEGYEIDGSKAQMKFQNMGKESVSALVDGAVAIIARDNDVTTYVSLETAIAAAQAGDTIDLLADVEASEVILIDKSLTINGNGHKVTSSATRVFRVTTADVEVTLNNVNMVSSAKVVYPNDVRGISIDAQLTNVKLTLNDCSVDFTDATANDWAYAVNVSGNGTGHTVTVNGGTYEGANVINVNGANNTVVVKDATLNCLYPDNDLYAGACIWVLQNQGSTVEATGNTFNGSNAVAFNLGTGTGLTESNNTDYTEKVVAKIGNTYYTSLAAAFAAAQDGDTIKLLHNITLTESVVNNGKTITLDLNGKTITGKDNNTSGNFYLINNNKGNLTITGNGTITLTATTERKWSASSVVVANNLGTLTIENGTIEHLGGTDMAYAIDNLTNGKNTVATLIVKGGTINSTYFAIRQFANGGTNNLTINGGTIGYAWMQSPNANANVANITVDGGNVAGICLSGDNAVVTLSAKTDCVGEIYGTIPAGMALTQKNGNYVLAKAVAKIGGVTYASVAEALAAAKGGETINLIWAEGDAPIAMNGYVSGKTVTITGTAQVDWEKGFLFVGRTNDGTVAEDAKLIFKDAKLMTTQGGDHGIHVSGAEKGSASKANGTVEIINSEINLSYLINKGTMTLDNSTLTVKNGFAVGGRPASETVSGVDATASITLNASKLIVDNHNGMGLGYEAIGVMNVNEGSTFETTKAFLITAKGTLNVNGGSVKVAGKLTNKGSIVFDATGMTACVVDSINATVEMSGGTVTAINNKYVYADVNNDGRIVLVNYVAMIGDQGYKTLQDAINNVANDETIVLVADIADDVTIKQVEGISFTIDGNGKTYSGTITIHGNSRYNGAETLTIQNVNFVTSEADHYFIDSNSTGSAERYAHNVTVENCTFTATPGTAAVNSAAAIRIRQGFNIVVKGSTANGMHSLFQAYGVSGLTITGNKVDGKNGISAGTSTDVVIEGNTIKATGYGIRADGDGAYGMTVKNNTVEAELPVVVRKATGTYALTLEGNTLTGGKYQVIFTKGDDGTYEEPADGYTVNADGLNVYPISDYVAYIGEKGYFTIADAIKAANAGDTVTVLEGTYAVPSMKAGITIVGEGEVIFNGTLTGTLENLTLKNIHIKGANAQRWAYAKGDLVFENVTFEATSVYALHFDGITAGATLTYKNCTIIGWAAMGGSPASCVFDGCTFKGNGSYGLIRVFFNATIENCTFDVANVNTNDIYEDGIHAVSGAEVIVNNCTNVNGSMADIVNVGDMSVVEVDGVVFQNYAKIGDTYYLSLADALNACKAGETVVLLRDVDLTGIDWEPVEFKGNFDGNGFKISNLVVNKPGVSNVGLFSKTTGAEIKNLIIENAKVTGYLNVGVVAGHPWTTKYTNIKVTGHVEVNGFAYVGGVGGKNAYANWTDITVDVDATSYVEADSAEYRTYVGGVIGFIGEGGHTFKNISSNIKVIGSTCDIGGLFGIAHYGNNFENVTFTGSVEAPADAEEVGGIAGVWHNEKGHTVTFTNAVSTGIVTIGDKTTTGSIVGGAYNAANETSENSGELVIDGEEVWLCVAKIGDNKYDTLAEAFAAAQNGDEVKIMLAGTYALSTSGKDITITGAVDGVVFDNIGAKGMNGANVTFNNVTFDYYPNVNYTGLQHSGNLVYNNCTFNGQVFLYGQSETFNNCTFNQNSADAYNVWTYGAKEVTFNKCTFNSAGKSVLIYAESASVTNDVTIADSTFNASAAVDGKAAIEMDSSLTGGIKLTIANTTATGFGSGNVSGNSLWNNKKGNEGVNNDITVVVNNETALQPIKTAKVGEVYYTTLQAAIAAAQNNETVTLLADIALSEMITIPAGKTLTLDLNGKTVSMETDDDKKTSLILNYGILTITDSNENNNGKLSYYYTGTNSNDAYNTIESAPGSKLTIEYGTIENLSTCLIAYAVDGLTNGGNGDVTINIIGGVLTSKKIAVRIFANSTTNTGILNISGGEIFGRVIIQNASAKANKAVLTITGGIFTANDYKTDVLYVGGSNGNSGDIKASVTGGSFSGEILSSIDAGFISGGTFSTDVSELCVKGYAPVKNNNGNYEVKIDTTKLYVSYEYNSSTPNYGINFFNNYQSAYNYAIKNAKNATIIIEKTNTLSGNCFDNNHKNYTKLAVVIKDGATMGVASSKWDMTYPVTVEAGGSLVSARPKSAGYINSHIKNTLTIGTLGSDKVAILDFLGGSYQSGSIAVLYNGKIVANNAKIEVGDLGLTGSATFNKCDITIDGVLAAGKNNFYKHTMTDCVVNVTGHNYMNENTYYSTTGTSLNNLTLTNSTITVDNGKDGATEPVTIKNVNLVDSTIIADDAEKIIINGTVKVDDVKAVAYIGTTFYTNLTDAFAAITDGTTLTILEGTYDAALVINKKDVTVIGIGNVTLNGVPSIKGTNYKVENIDFVYSTGSTNLSGSGLIKDCTFTATGNAFRYCYGTKDAAITFEGCTLNAPNGWAIHFDSAPGMELTLTDCEINGRVALGGDLGSLNATGTTFEDGYVNVWGTVDGATFTKCEFVDIPYIFTGYDADNTFNFTGCTVVVNGESKNVTDVIYDGNDAAAAEIYVDGALKSGVAKIGDTYYKTLEEAFAAAAEGDTIILLKDATPALKSQRAITKASVIDLNGKTLTLTEDDLYFGSIEFKNGTIVVDPSVKVSTAVFWMFENQILTFNDVDLVATGVTGTYLIGINGGTATKVELINSSITIANTDVKGLTAVICDNGTGNSVVIDGTAINVANIDGRFYLGGTNGSITVNDSVVTLNGVKEGFYLRAGQKLSIEGVSNVDIVLNKTEGRYGINLTDATAKYIKADSATVNATSNSVAQIGATYYATLADALAAVKNGETITLLVDCAEDVTVVQTPDVEFTIDGNGKTYSGTITVDGKSAAYATAGLTIKNVNFNATNISAEACINLGVKGNNNTRYTSNVTVIGCTFTGTDCTKVAVKNYTGGCKNLTVKNSSATGMHSLIQVKGVAGLTVENVTIENCKNGISVGTSTGITITKANITATGYGIRVDASVDTKLTIDNSTINAYTPVVVREATASGYAIDFATTNMTAGNGKYYVVVGKAEYEAGKALPMDAAYAVAITGVDKDKIWQPLEGTGSVEDPYLIENLDDLIFFRDSVNAGGSKYSVEGAYVVLTADIDLASVKNWAPIGTFDYSFDGNFNGKGHKIMNLEMSDNTAANGYAYLGFFGVTANNTIENFVIENVTINSNGQIVAAAIAYPYYTTVKDITVCGNIAIKGGNYTAGVLGYTRLCENASNLTVSGNAGSYITGAIAVGGVVADIQMNNGLTANYSNFSVSGLTITGDKCVGGITGIIGAQTIDGVTVQNVTLVSSDSRVGIVAGSLGTVATIKNVTASNVTGATAIIGGAYNGGAAIQAKIGDTYYATFAYAYAAAQKDDKIVILSDLTITETLVISKDITLDLNNAKLTGMVYPVIRVIDDATVTVTNGYIVNNDYIFVLGASDGSSAGNLIIKDGYYVGETTIASVTKGTLTILGGTFKCLDGEYGSTYLLNCIDANFRDGSAKIFVEGGTFYGFDPKSNAAEGVNTSFMAKDYCTVAGANDVYIVVKHIYQAVVTAPTCTAEGYTTYTCSVCGDTYVADKTDALGHKYSYLKVYSASCTEDGYFTIGCKQCGEYFDSRYDAEEIQEYLDNLSPYVTIDVTAKGHKYEAVVTAPTCTTEGYTTYTCSACGDTYVADETAALGHTYDKVVTDPTCTTEGYTTYTCSVCGYTYVADKVAAKGHTVAIDDAVAPTCTATGLTVGVHCSVCKEVLVKQATVAAKGHTWTPATYEAPKTCSVCGATEGEALHAVAQIGAIKYATLAEAIAAAQNGDTITLLTNSTGSGVVIDKSITIDLNGKTYTVNKTVGSAGTTTLGFQILKGNDVTFKNGTLAATATVEGKPVKVLIQNYANLTLTDVVLDGTGSEDMLYVLSNNCGDTVIEGNSKIIAPDSAVAFDVWDYRHGGYTLPTVTVADTVTVKGNVEAAAKVGNTYYATFDAALAAAEAGDTIKLIVPVTVKADKTINIEGITIESEGDAFIVTAGTLTINGNGVVKAGTSGVGSWCAVWANGGKVVINDGTYSVGGDANATDKTHQNDVIYTKNGGIVEINGGLFLNDGTVWTLNENDSNRGTITVKGGTFENWNPANNVSEGADTSFVAEGHLSIKNGDNYVVIARLIGDVNGNGKIDGLDAVLVKQYVFEIIGADRLDLSVADVTGDGLVDEADVAKFGQYQAGLIPTLSA